MSILRKSLFRKGISLLLLLALVFSMSLAVTPTYKVYAAGQNIALNKTGTALSVEGSGFEAGKAFDGNATTRWASVEYSDPQWIYVDLGASYNVGRVNLSWEDAYAKSYRIEVSTDKTNWTTVYSTTSGNGATDDITFNSASGRYVRMYGTQRGTSYGYSLYEFEVYESETIPQVPAVPTGLTASAASTSQINVSWSSVSGATGYDLEVDGTVRSDVTNPYAHTGLGAGSSHSYRIRAKNSAGTSAWSSIVSASTQTVSANIALNKTGTALSEEGSGFEAGKAFDGNATTRWSSVEYVDPQWIYVDLGASYNIGRVKLLWEAAYAKSYRLEVSSDKTNWTTVFSTTNGDGGTDDISFSTSSGRYVRMYGTQRGTSYGYSLYEFEVYESGTAPQVPGVPTGLAASAASSSQINVSWSSVSGATGYDLEVDGTVRSDVTSPYAHTGLTANSSHNYKVRAKNTAGTSAWSSIVSATTLPSTGGVARPFPQNLSYSGCIKPSNRTQQQLNNDVISYYTNWKTDHLRTSPVTSGGYYVYSPTVTGDDVVNPITCSEAHGYGMMITALMAGYDSNAKTYFDGLYKMYNAHRSPIDNDLMAWAIGASERPEDCGGSAATDGDMDIAYGLLLAHYQWGSSGSINYLSEAKRIINNGIKGSEVSTSTYKTLLGDWNVNQPHQTRSSDWMTDHFRVFAAATGDSFWNNVANTAYSLISRIHTNYSSATGLVPDFVENNPAVPAGPKFLESVYDGDYYYNACRYPWRIATDYALFGTSEAKTAMNKLVNWLKTKTSNNPNNIAAGYKLSDGTAIGNYVDMAFVAPFTAACIVDSAHQNYLNQGWSLISSTREDYYGDSISLLCMILISGNWWAPQ